MKNDKYLAFGSKLVIRLANSQHRYLFCQSFLKKGIVFRESFADQPFDNSLFVIEGEDIVSSKFASNVSYSVWFYLKHHKTGKFIGLSQSVKQQATDTIYDLELKDDLEERSLFRLSQCYIYQSKISNNIKPGEELYLVAKLKNDKQVFMSYSPESKAIATYNTKHPIIIDFYSYAEIPDCYNFADHVLITHSETQTYLCQNKNEETVRFQEFIGGKEVDVTGVWMIEAENQVEGGGLLFQQKVRFRNLVSKQYLSFSLKAKLVENFKIYPVVVQPEAHQNTIFKPISVNKKDGHMPQGSYFLLQNSSTLGFLSNQTENNLQKEVKRFVPTCTAQAHPRDVFRLQLVSYGRTWSINCLVSIKAELKAMTDQITQGKKIRWSKLMPSFIECLSSLKLVLAYLTHMEQQDYNQFSRIQSIFQPCISKIVGFMSVLTMAIRSNELKPHELSQLYKSVQISNSILTKLVLRSIPNKDVLSQHIMYLMDFVCMNVGAEELLGQLFTNHIGLVITLDKPLVRRESQQKQPPILQIYLQKLYDVCQKSRGRQSYDHVIKFIKICNAFILCDGSIVGYNQTYITSMLFGEQRYKNFMFGCKVINDRVRVDLKKEERDIEDIKEDSEEFPLLMEQLNLFSLLCTDRNMIAKNELSKIFSCGTLINYIQMPISQKLKRIIFKLITNIYVDSNPRTPRIIPHSILVFSTETLELVEPLSTQENYMSHRLNERLIQQNGETMRIKLHNKKLNLSNVNNEEQETLVMDSEELELYYMILEERIEQKLFSNEMFDSIGTLIRLECLKPQKIYKLFLLLLQSLETHIEMVSDCVFQLLELISCLFNEMHLNRLICIAKLIYFSQRDMELQIKANIKYILPGELSLPQSQIQLPPQNKEHQSYLVDEFNEFGMLLDLPNKFKPFIMQQFRSTKSLARRKLLFSLIVKWELPKQSLLRQLESCVILTDQSDIELADYLFNLYKRLYRVYENSEIWLVLSTPQHKSSLRTFCNILNDMISFLYESHQVKNSREYDMDYDQLPQLRTIRHQDVSFKRQTLLCNIGLHTIVLKFLVQNFFMLQGVKTPGLLCYPFLLCFDFLHGFILKNNNYNKNIVEIHVSLFFKYLNYVDLGQALVLSELYKNHYDLCRRVNEKSLLTIVNRITEKQVSEGYSPTLAKFIQNICIIDEQPDIDNLEMLMKLLSNQQILRNMLYMENKNGNAYTFNLDLKNILNGGVPYIYHSVVLKLINTIFENIRLGFRPLQHNILNTLDFNYLLMFLCKQDSFTSPGVQAKLTLLLKLQIYKLIKNVYIHSETDMAELKKNDNVLTILNFLVEQIDKIQQNYRDEVTDRSMEALLETYEPHLRNFQQQLSLTYEQFLAQYVMPTVKIFQGQLEKHKDLQAYKLLMTVQQKILDGQRKMRKSTNNKTKLISQNHEKIFNFINFPLANAFLHQEDKSKQHQSTFVNKFYTTILLDSHVRQIVEEQQNQFLKSDDSDRVKSLALALISFTIDLSIEIDEDSIVHQEHLHLLTKAIDFLAKMLAINTFKQQLVDLFLRQKLLKNMFSMVTQGSFNIRHLSENQLFFSLLNLFNNMIGEGNNHEVVKEISTILTADRNSHKILSQIKNTIVQSSVIKESSVSYAINQIFRKVTLSYEGNEVERRNPVEISLLFISNLCNNSEIYPFTRFLRRQKANRANIDIMPIIVNAIMAQMLDRQNNQYQISVTFSKFRLLIELIKTLQALLYGPNEENQLYLMETKFPTILFESMKIDQQPAREQIVNQDQKMFCDVVRDKLETASIPLSLFFQTELAKKHLSHDVFLNLVKNRLLYCVKDMIRGNDSTFKRLAIFLPEEYLQVNLIWIYDLFKTEAKLQFTKDLVSQFKPDLLKMMRDPESQGKLVLQNGFLIFQLIKMYSDAQKSQKNTFDVEEEEEKKSSEEKKLAIVKKFFERLKVEDLPSVFTQIDSHYQTQIKMYQQLYREAVKFFGENTVSIEINFQERIYKVFFPKMPVCKYFSSKHKKRFSEEANRLSQISKLHSLMESANGTIDELELEEAWQSRVSKVNSYVNYLFDFDLIMIVSLIAAIIMSILIFISIQTPDFILPFKDVINPTTDAVVHTLQAICGLCALLLFIMLITKSIPLSIGKAQRIIDGQNQKTVLKKASIYVSNILSSSNSYVLIMFIFNLLTTLQPAFCCFILIDIFRIVDTARNVVVAIGQTWKQLLAGTAIFILLNYVFSFLYYVAYSDLYGPTCQSLYTCFLFLNDFFFKNGPGFYGSIPKDYTGTISTIDFFVDLSYIIFACTVVKQIFSGTIIDKFCELREKKDDIREDQASNCYICAMSRYELDFELEGFQNHLDNTHCVYNYIYYIYYLKRKQKKSYSRIEKYVRACVDRNDDQWFPIENSLYKINRQKRINEQLEEQSDDKHDEQMVGQREMRKKLLKQIKNITETVLSNLKQPS